MEEQEISLLDIFFTLLNKWPALVMSFIVAAALTFAFTMAFVQPKYESVGKLYVSSESSRVASDDNISLNTVTTNQRLVNTYIEILKSDSFLEAVSEDLDDGKKSYSAASIKNMINMTAVNNTEILQVAVRCTDPYDAYRINQAIIINSSAEIERVLNGGSVSIIDNASMPSGKVSPNVTKNTAIGGLAGLIIGAAVIFLMHMLDTRVKAGDDLQTRYSIPVLGEVPWILELKN